MLRYAITGGSLTDVRRPETARLLAQFEQLARDGVDFLLLREKSLSPTQLAELTRRALACTAGSSLRVLVHTDTALALAEGAAGVHLSHAADIPAARAAFPKTSPTAFISVSCHTLADIDAARRHRASAALFSPVFGKSVAGTEVVPGTGLDLLGQACLAAAPMPVFALGGVTLANASACIAAGAAGVAGIRLFFPGE